MSAQILGPLAKRTTRQTTLTPAPPEPKVNPKKREEKSTAKKMESVSEQLSAQNKKVKPTLKEMLQKGKDNDEDLT